MGPPPPYTLLHSPPPPPSLSPPFPPPFPPPLPPRSLQPTTTPSSHPDARSASQVSLVPASSDGTKRTLLLIYIHGFMGNETSFQAFPVHLHNLLCVIVAPLGYLVHTKVYPKFKTRHHILAAAETFSRWLSSFERDTVDVVLLGHSMGGLLSAEVALLRDNAGRTRHRLLGIVSFDTPFLGMHPGIITAGISSLFRSSPAASPPAQSSLDGIFAHKPLRNFTIAVPKPEPGPWESTLHFIEKHHARLTKATSQYLLSHLEFGACLADPVGLVKRYAAIRRCADVGFVNYYTASTGRTKEPRPPEDRAAEEEAKEAAREERRWEKETREYEKVLRAQEKREQKENKKEERRGREAEKRAEKAERRRVNDEGNRGEEKRNVAEKEVEVEEEKEEEEKWGEKEEKNEKWKGKDVESWQRLEEKEKNAEKRIAKEAEEGKEAEQGHEQQEQARLAREQSRMEAESRRMNGIPEPLYPPPPPPPEYESATACSFSPPPEQWQDEPIPEPKKRERHFCILPRDAADNNWIKVPMEGVDEVGAHCGLFMPNPTYEQLVGDVAVRVEAWVEEVASRRVAGAL